MTMRDTYYVLLTDNNFSIIEILHLGECMLTSVQLLVVSRSLLSSNDNEFTQESNVHSLSCNLQQATTTQH